MNDTILKERMTMRARAAVVRILDANYLPVGNGFYQYRDGWNDEKVIEAVLVAHPDEKVRTPAIEYMREQAYGPFPPATPKVERALADRVAVLEKLQRATAEELAATRASCAAMQVHINHLYHALGEPMPIGPVAMTNGDGRVRT